MSDDYSNDEFDADNDEQDNGIPENFRTRMRSLEKDAKQSRKVAEENAVLQRELAFTKAGIDTDKDPRLTYFAKGYDGEMTAEAIRQAAESAGFLTPSSASSVADAEMAALDRVSQASVGTASRTSDEDRVASLKQAGAQGRQALIAEMQRQGMSVTAD